VQDGDENKDRREHRCRAKPRRAASEHVDRHAEQDRFDQQDGSLSARPAAQRFDGYPGDESEDHREEDGRAKVDVVCGGGLGFNDCVAAFKLSHDERADIDEYGGALQ